MREGIKGAMLAGLKAKKSKRKRRVSVAGGNAVSSQMVQGVLTAALSEETSGSGM